MHDCRVARIGISPQCEPDWRAYATRTQACRWRRRLSEGSGHIVTRSMGCCIDADSKSIAQRRPSHEWRLAPCGSADTRCANLRAIFDSVVLALTNRPVWAQLSPALPPFGKGRREAQQVRLRTLLCAEKRYGAEEAIFLFAIRKGCRHPKFSSLRAQSWCHGGHAARVAPVAQGWWTNVNTVFKR